LLITSVPPERQYGALNDGIRVRYFYLGVLGEGGNRYLVYHNSSLPKYPPTLTTELNIRTEISRPESGFFRSPPNNPVFTKLYSTIYRKSGGCVIQQSPPRRPASFFRHKYPDCPSKMYFNLLTPNVNYT